MLDWVPLWYWVGLVLLALALGVDAKKSPMGFWGGVAYGIFVWLAGTLAYWGCWVVWSLTLGLVFHTPFDVPWWLWILIFIWPTATYGPAVVIETANFIIAIRKK